MWFGLVWFGEVRAKPMPDAYNHDSLNSCFSLPFFRQAVASAAALETKVSKQAFRITHLLRAIESGVGGGGEGGPVTGVGGSDPSVRKGACLGPGGRWH